MPPSETLSASQRFFRRWYPFDWLIVGYSLLMVVVILLLGRPLGKYLDEVAFYLVAALFSVAIVSLIDEDTSRLAAGVRLLYPVFLFTFFYRATGGLMFLLFDRFFDAQLTAFELSIFGVNPTLYIDRHWLNPIVTEILSFCYFCYYFMIPVFVIMLFVKKHYETVKSFLTATCLTFFLSYLLFFLYPIEGPRWHFAGQYLNSVTGPVFRPLVEMVIAKGAVRGGCMPSSHFGVALVILMYTFRYYRRVGWWLAPLVFGLAAGTVWGRFHYVSDVVVGGVLGLLSVLLTWRFYPRWRRRVAASPSQKELKTEYVS